MERIKDDLPAIVVALQSQDLAQLTLLLQCEDTQLDHVVDDSCTAGEDTRLDHVVDASYTAGEDTVRD
jgi:hypothetical protein